MVQRYLQKLSRYYLEKNRWWLPLLIGGLYSLALPPFNHEFHPLFALFPLLGFIVLIPLCAFALQPSLKRAMAHVFSFGFAAALGQYYWLAFDKVEGVWVLILVGLALIAALISLWVYLTAGMLLRVIAARFPRAYVLLFPAIWVAIDYSRTLGEIAFPWAFLGYSLTPLGPLAQTASVTGVWGLTFILVMGNVLVWEFLKSCLHGSPGKRPARSVAIFAALVAAMSVAGWIRIDRHATAPAASIKVALLQSNIDPFHWGNRSLDTAFEVNEALVTQASRDKPDLLILPESALLCYVNHRAAYRTRVETWLRQTRIPLIFGSLDWESAPSGSYYEYFVFNAAFLADTTPGAALRPYHKIKLVPFGEGIPFEASLPILSRVNLGEADFHRGRERIVFHIGSDIKAAPFICYESNFPGFVRDRVRRGVNLMVNITNDGWFGKSSGPYHHAMMARMRSVENGVTLARCANSGISMFVDPLGRVIAGTGLYERTILTRTVPRYTIPTIYSRYGDWFVLVCGGIIAAGVAAALLRRLRPKPNRA